MCLVLRYLRKWFLLRSQVGTWTERRGVNMSRNFSETYTEIVESLQNKTLVVTTIMVSLLTCQHK